MRLVPRCHEPVAFVVSKGGKVKWCVRSESFVYTVRKNNLEGDTYAYAVQTDPREQHLYGPASAGSWLVGVAPEMMIHEESVLLPGAGLTYTFPVPPFDEDDAQRS